MKKITVIALLLVSQLSTLSAQNNKEIDQRIVEVYGDAISTFNQEQVAWLYTKLKRTEIRQLKAENGEQFPKLSSLRIVDKYVPGLKMEKVFDPAHINPLKYTLDFYNKKDLIYRIDGTDYIVFVNKAK